MSKSPRSSFEVTSSLRLSLPDKSNPNDTGGAIGNVQENLEHFKIDMRQSKEAFAVPIINSSGVVNGSQFNDTISIRADETRINGKPYSIQANLGDGNDIVAVNYSTGLNANLNGGAGNDTFIVSGQISQTPGKSGFLNINGDAGIDTLRLYNAQNYTITAAGDGTFTLKGIKNNDIINLTGVERLAVNDKSYVSLGDLQPGQTLNVAEAAKTMPQKPYNAR